jgi:hypothetical protein
MVPITLVFLNKDTLIFHTPGPRRVIVPSNPIRNTTAKWSVNAAATVSIPVLF